MYGSTGLKSLVPSPTELLGQYHEEEEAEPKFERQRALLQPHLEKRERDAQRQDGEPRGGDERNAVPPSTVAKRAEDGNASTAGGYE
jgi:hypothetical protein